MTDLRCLGVVPPSPVRVARDPPLVTLIGVYGLASEFGSNCQINLGRYDRLIFHNGSHRNCALSELTEDQTKASRPRRRDSPSAQAYHFDPLPAPR